MDEGGRERGRTYGKCSGKERYRIERWGDEGEHGKEEGMKE